ncbi:DUF6471 domain-containing protein [Aestuariibacter halophilus]|uniref:DUF6471 domain-containing protein n=1 Tax=Fluctibacter halophilus TaxID=226011 RepID=A0ABS8G394_9ALTE|nr:DUF6471 domain-containing protein [Aestuariibacter halophilus]MCC2614928.1 DUF6471 domain-containing protein [Aestuariibacter halophilus]
MSNLPRNSDWRALVTRSIRAEMLRRNIKYQELSDSLQQLGVQQSADNLRNKINKGILGADLLLQIVYVLNMRNIGRDEIVLNLADMGFQMAP